MPLTPLRMQYIRRAGSLGEINHAAALEEHDDEGSEKEQEHEQVHHAIAFAARVLDVVHIFRNEDGACCKDQKTIGQK